MEDINLSTKGFSLLSATFTLHPTAPRLHCTAGPDHQKALALAEGAGKSQEFVGSRKWWVAANTIKTNLLLSLLHWHPFLSQRMESCILKANFNWRKRQKSPGQWGGRVYERHLNV